MNPITLLLGDLGGKLIDRLFPDPAQRAAAQTELLKLTMDQQAREAADALARDLAQAKINEVEAASTDLFRGGWRPFVGWVCGAGLAINFLVAPALPWFVSVIGHVSVPPFPQLDMEMLTGLLFALLGLGGLRTVERVKGKV